MTNEGKGVRGREDGLNEVRMVMRRKGERNVWEWVG